MALPNAYLVTTRNLESFLNSLQSAKAPERFTTKFLAQLDFSSSNDRLLIGVLKALGFVDESGVPTKRYYEFLDQTQSARVLADALREAYSDLFALNKNAQTMTVDEVKNKFRTLTQGQKSENVVSLMANTFTALAGLADWESPSPEVASPSSPPPTPSKEVELATELPPKMSPSEPPSSVPPLGRELKLHYDIHIHLPESRDPAVYDAIFQALRRHLA